MLQRAASNAYSWWWASHIRTKQSKWLEQNLQDMEEKVQAVLKLIEEDGDSFAKRAEMYYKKRPELINFVEESYRAYRALAERYEHISTELQNANNTIAYVFPEQVQFSMDDEDDAAAAPGGMPKKPPEVPKGNIPKVPKLPKDLKTIFTIATKKVQAKKARNSIAAKRLSSGLSKAEGLQEIDRFQKQILTLQTEKEFAKSSYEVSLGKYWQIDEKIQELQKKVCVLQDEFGSGTVIEDDDARSLMASTALRSCHETLSKLQEKQERSVQEAEVEQKRINEARNKLKSLAKEFSHGQNDQEKQEDMLDSTEVVSDPKNSGGEVNNIEQQRQELESLRAKIKEHFEVESSEPLSLTDLAEKIDEHVNKVISLETAVTSQTALIKRLRTETDELQLQIQTLENDKATLIDGKNDLNGKLREMEQKLRDLQDLNEKVVDQNNNLQTHFTEAHGQVDHLSGKLQIVNSDKEVQVESLSVGKPEESPLNTQFKTQEEQTDNEPKVSGKVQEELSIQGVVTTPETGNEQSQDLEVFNFPSQEQEQSDKAKLLMDFNDQENSANKSDQSEKVVAEDENKHDQITSESNFGDNNDKLQMDNDPGISDHTTDKDDPDWKQLFMNGMENREKVLLTEYTTVLRNFKEMKKKLAESEKKRENSNSLFDITLQLKEMKSANAKKDEQIQNLRQKLRLVEGGLGEENESAKSMVTDSPPKEDIDVILADQTDKTSPIEEKFRASIDEVLEENLEFWFRFSNTYQQIQKFDTETKDLQSEFSKVEGKLRNQEGSSTAKYSLRSDAKPLFKHLREIHTELGVWLEQCVLLKDELKGRFSSLCEIQEEILTALKESAEDEDFKFTSYQAAKFQGEILNMKQENNKVADELQAGLDHITTLQLEVEKTLAKLNEEFKLSGSKHNPNFHLPHSDSRTRVPLRSFIFGVKQKRQKHSIFSCVHPILHRRNNGLKSGPL